VIDTVSCTVLVDDAQAAIPGITAEHGLAFWIVADGTRILFDSGQTERVLRENSRSLGIDLGDADAAAISHGHYDHTGGIAGLLEDRPDLPVFLHPDALLPRFSRSADGSARAIGMPARTVRLLAGRGAATRVARGAAEIRPGVFLTGEVPRTGPPEAPTARFFLDERCTVPDPFRDDQALVVDTEEGAVVFLGCSHAGVSNTVTHALSLSRTGRLLALVGGMHLAQAPRQEVEKLADRLAQLAPRAVGPSHCTGGGPASFIRNRLPAAFVAVSAGTILTSHHSL
jgi:7,8-dihydropterin-6-yl-methyl-4-(beta-D-ribofuranosyl)aminobenzene 5'-phosphate synthase